MKRSRCGGDTITLLPVEMVIPNDHCVYSPNQAAGSVTMTAAEFERRYGRHRHKIRVCFDADPDPATIYERSQQMTAYGSGIDCWYIISDSMA